jgi:hypothetical protein
MSIFLEGAQNEKQVFHCKWDTHQDQVDHEATRAIQHKARPALPDE